MDFKSENKESWRRNSDYWLHAPLRQVEDTRDFFKEKLRHLIARDDVIVDMGCGSGWLLAFIAELKIPFRYIGIDFTKEFIEAQATRYADDTQVSFELLDLEENIPERLTESAHVVFNCFNFFELLDLDAAFANAAKMVRPGGRLVVFTIDVTFLILAVSKTMDDFHRNLRSYEAAKTTGTVPHFFQQIDLGDSESRDLKYASVLYSLGDYFNQAKKHKMAVEDYGEVIKTSKFIPKTYQYIVFRK